MYKSKTFAGMIILLVLFCSFLAIYNGEIYSTGASDDSGREIWVDDDYPFPNQANGCISKPYGTIQIAIDVSNDGDKIKVLPGEYSGDLVITKSISLIGDDRENTIISSSAKSSYLIDITADSVSIEDFTICDYATTSHRKAVIHVAPDVEDAVIVNNILNISSYGRGIYLDGSYSSIIKNNTINGTRGVYIRESSVNTLQNNKIEACGTASALYLISSNSNEIKNNTLATSAYGISCSNSNENIIKSNEIFGNDHDGIHLTNCGNDNISENEIHNNGNTGISLGSSQSNIMKNEIYDNGIGINLPASGCTIQENDIRNSVNYALYAASGSKNNVIFNNTFENNCKNAEEHGDNEWDNGTLGNYWDDYYGPDPDYEGNLDSLTESDFYYTNGGVRDEHPKGRFQQPPEVSDPIPEHLQEGVELSPSLKINVNDPDPQPYKDRLDVEFYYILDNESYLIGSTKADSGSTASIPFYSTVQGQNAVYSYIGTGYDYICVWYATAKDQYSETKSSEYIFSTLNTPVDNNPPTADAGGQYDGSLKKNVYRGQIGENIQFDGSGCNDADGNIQFYRWSFGDGASSTDTISPSHIYQDSGIFSGSLVIIDNDGSSDTSSFYVLIETQTNDPPAADAGGPYKLDLGKSVSFSSKNTFDPDPYDVLNYFWNFGDGTNSTEANPSHLYSKAYNYSVTLTVTDEKGLSDISTTYALVITTEDDSPGFELILLVLGILMFAFILRKNRN